MNCGVKTNLHKMKGTANQMNISQDKLSVSFITCRYCGRISGPRFINWKMNASEKCEFFSSNIWHSRTYTSLSNYSMSTFVEQWILSEHLTFTECYVFSKSIKIYQKFYWYLVLLDIHWMSTEDIGTFPPAQQLHFQNCWKKKLIRETKVW